MYDIMGDEYAELADLEDAINGGWGYSDADVLSGDTDILGMYDIMGEDPNKQALMNKAATARRLRQGQVLTQYAPRKGRQLILGFSSTGTVPAATTVDIIQRPQLTFRPERIFIPAAIGANFNVADVRIGKNSQFLSAGAVPGAVFSETVFGGRLKMDTCQIAQDIDLRVTNISAGDLNFFAAMIGDSAE